MKNEGDKVTVEQKDGKKICYRVEPFVKDFEESALEIKEEHKGIVVYNTKENFNNLMKSWEPLTEVKNLTIYFINPFSKTEKKWAVNPRTHAMITDKEALEPGMTSMFAMVDETTQKEIEQLTS